MYSLRGGVAAAAAAASYYFFDVSAAADQKHVVILVGPDAFGSGGDKNSCSKITRKEITIYQNNIVNGQNVIKIVRRLFRVSHYTGK